MNIESIEEYKKRLHEKAINTLLNAIEITSNAKIIRLIANLVKEIENSKLIEYENKLISEPIMQAWRNLFYETDNKIKVIKAIREYTNLGLRECKYFFDFILFDKPMV